MKLSVRKFCQRDPRWSAEKLGTSASTIGDFGCAITCLAMVEDYYGFNTDPQRINQLLIQNKCYVNRNLLDFTKIGLINEFVTFKERIDCPTKPAPLEKIDTELNEGRPVIAQVDLNPNEPGPDHFVVIIGKTEDNHYIALDPWYDEDAIFFDVRYGEPSKGIFGLRLVNGPVPHQDAPKPSVVDLEGQIEAYRTHLEDIKEHLRPAGVVASDDFPKIVGAIDELVEIKHKYEQLLEANDIPKPVENEEILFQFPIGKLTIRLVTKRGDDK